VRCSSLEEVRELLASIRSLVSVDKDSIPSFTRGGLGVLDEFKDCFIDVVVGGLLGEAEKWIHETQHGVEQLVKALSLTGFTYPREFRSFVENPRHHLRKKIFNYVYDLARGRLGFEEFVRKAGAALRTSIRTNMRTAYQIWGLTQIMRILAEEGYYLAYPEHGFISFDRSGKQRLGIIPPNAVLGRIDEGFISIFHEAPRPLGWEDTGDLQRVWSLYTALRPDAMIYTGMVLNIVDLSRSPPIKRPTIILEFKELEDWYNRVRDLKGYFRKPLTAEEWRSMWLEGLFQGLADIMGVKRSEVRERVEEARSLRVREYQLVKLYKTVYNPEEMILITRSKTPSDVREELENHGIIVYDDVGFDSTRLRRVAEEIRRHASFNGAREVTLRLPLPLAKKLQRVMKKLGASSLEEMIEKLGSLINT